MTKEEAINDLKDFIDTYITVHGEEDTIAVSLDNVDVEAFHVAIKALEQEPCEDAVSRQAVLDMASVIETDDYSGNEILEVVDVDDIKALPSVTPARKLKQEPCKDAISRKAVLDTLDKMDSVLDEDRTVETYKKLLAACYKDLPSVTSVRKKGK